MSEMKDIKQQPDVRAKSSTGRFTSSSLRSIAKASFRLPTSLTLDGPLPRGKQLTLPITIKIEDDEGEILVSESNFFIHASGATIPEAVAEFERVLVDELDLLTADESQLSLRLQAQLQFLRSHIRTM